MDLSLLQYARDLEYLGYDRNERKTILETTDRKGLDARLEYEFRERSKMTFSATGTGAMALIVPSLAGVGAAHAETPLAKYALIATGVAIGVPVVVALVKGFLASQYEYDRAREYGPTMG